MVAAAAYERCLRLARDHYENFPVASRLLPRAVRPHVAAIYAFARVADDFADEGDRPAPERLALLDGWGERLQGITRGSDPFSTEIAKKGSDPGSARPGSDPLRAISVEKGSDPLVADPLFADAVFVALGDTIQRFALEPSLFEDLLSAFRQDVTVTRYETWDDVLDYCRRSANPVGRLVLRLFGRRDARLDAWSDDICTALQLTNFWQDLAIDWQKGRLYVPLDVVHRAGADLDDLSRRRMTPAWREAMSVMAMRTRDLFTSGRPIADAVSGRLRWELRATWLGGMRILDRLVTSGFDVFHRRPTLGWSDALAIGGRAVTW